MFKKTIMTFTVGLLMIVPLGAQQKRMPELSSYTIAKALEAQEIATFPLTEAFLDKMEKIQALLVELPITQEENTTGDDLTVNGLTRAIERHPRVLSILVDYEMDPRDYVLGSMALSNALLAVTTQEGEEIFLDEPRPISVENQAFGRNYADRIRALYGG